MEPGEYSEDLSRVVRPSPTQMCVNTSRDFWLWMNCLLLEEPSLLSTEEVIVRSLSHNIKAEARRIPIFPGCASSIQQSRALYSAFSLPFFFVQELWAP